MLRYKSDRFNQDQQYQILLFSFRPILNMLRDLSSICFESGGSIRAW